MSDDLEKDWALVRPDPTELEQMEAVAIPLVPNRLLSEVIGAGGIITSAAVPAGTVYAVSDPEFVGSLPEDFGQMMPIRTELNPGPEPIGWTVSEMSPAEVAERDTPEHLQRMSDRRNGEPFSDESSTVWTSLPVLTELWGRPWNAGAANFLRSLRPSSVRVARYGEGVHCDARTWRVTVSLAEGNVNIARITQEVDVGGTGFRDGQDASNYYSNQEQRLSTPRGSGAIVNTRGVRRLRLDGS